MEPPDGTSKMKATQVRWRLHGERQSEDQVTSEDNKEKLGQLKEREPAKELQKPLFLPQVSNTQQTLDLGRLYQFFACKAKYTFSQEGYG